MIKIKNFYTKKGWQEMSEWCEGKELFKNEGIKKEVKNDRKERNQLNGSTFWI